MERGGTMYGTGHASVKYNEKADKLAPAAEPTDQPLLFSQDIALLCQQTVRQGISEALLHSDEGDRLLRLRTPFSASSSSHQKGPDRCHNNQLTTGNISSSTLDLLLSGRLKDERVSVCTDIPSPRLTRQPK